MKINKIKKLIQILHTLEQHYITLSNEVNALVNSGLLTDPELNELSEFVGSLRKRD